MTEKMKKDTCIDKKIVLIYDNETENEISNKSITFFEDRESNSGIEITWNELSELLQESIKKKIIKSISKDGKIVMG